jgi:hypothetical protein
MKARQLIDGAAFGPDALKALGRTFDEAWVSISASVGTDPLVVDGARQKLANILLSIADNRSRGRNSAQGSCATDLQGTTVNECPPGWSTRRGEIAGCPPGHRTPTATPLLAICWDYSGPRGEPLRRRRILSTRI